MVYERQKTIEIFYTQLHHANYKKTKNDNGHILPKFLGEPIGDQRFDLAGKMLSHIMGKTLQPMDENWKDAGDLV